MVSTSTIVTASVATAVTGFFGMYSRQCEPWLSPRDPGSVSPFTVTEFWPSRSSTFSSLSLPRTPFCDQGTDPRIAYAVYFDYKRRTDTDFRRNLRRNERRLARVEKEEAAAASNRQRQEIRKLVEQANEEGFVTDPEEKEAYFMEQVSEGERLGADRECHSL
jgi:hypothetical protein